MAGRIEEELVLAGIVVFAKSPRLPAGAIGDADIEAGADLAASKLEHEHRIPYAQADGADVAAETRIVHLVRGVSAEVIDVDVVCQTPPTGDHTVSVDVQKADQASGALASILSATIDIDDTTAAYEILSGSIASASLDAGDALAVVVTTAGTTGSQAQGLAAAITTREKAA
jgi:hypothetical protein